MSRHVYTAGSMYASWLLSRFKRLFEDHIFGRVGLCYYLHTWCVFELVTAAFIFTENVNNKPAFPDWCLLLPFYSICLANVDVIREILIGMRENGEMGHWLLKQKLMNIVILVTRVLRENWWRGESHTSWKAGCLYSLRQMAQASLKNGI